MATAPPCRMPHGLRRWSAEVEPGHRAGARPDAEELLGTGGAGVGRAHGQRRRAARSRGPCRQGRGWRTSSGCGPRSVAPSPSSATSRAVTTELRPLTQDPPVQHERAPVVEPDHRRHHAGGDDPLRAARRCRTGSRPASPRSVSSPPVRIPPATPRRWPSTGVRPPKADGSRAARRWRDLPPLQPEVVADVVARIGPGSSGPLPRPSTRRWTAVGGISHRALPGVAAPAGASAGTCPR